MSPSLVSINVQTLQEDRSAGLQGRTPFIREQLDRLGVCITGLQETRAAKAETVREMSKVAMEFSCGFPAPCLLLGLMGHRSSSALTIYASFIGARGPLLPGLLGARFGLLWSCSMRRLPQILPGTGGGQTLRPG